MYDLISISVRQFTLQNGTAADKIDMAGTLGHHCFFLQFNFIYYFIYFFDFEFKYKMLSNKIKV